MSRSYLARLLAYVALLVFGAVTLAWWGFLAWLIWLTMDADTNFHFLDNDQHFLDNRCSNLCFGITSERLGDDPLDFYA
jgi:hypothetical protein